MGMPSLSSTQINNMGIYHPQPQLQVPVFNNQNNKSITGQNGIVMKSNNFQQFPYVYPPVIMKNDCINNNQMNANIMERNLTTLIGNKAEPAFDKKLDPSILNVINELINHNKK